MKRQATVSAFSNYVFDTVTKNARSARETNSFCSETWNGSISEENMRQYRAVAAQGRWTTDNPVKKWKVIHQGQANDESKRIFECRFLSVDDSPLRGTPDLVLESDDDRKHKVILIVERKLRTAIDYAGVPDGSWANVRAQLWSYAWITDWDWYRDSNVILMAEYFWRPFPSQGDAVYLGCRGVWNRGDGEFNRESKAHFLRYGGQIDRRLQIPE